MQMNQDYLAFHRIGILIYWYTENLMGLGPWAVGLTGLGVDEPRLGWADHSRAHSWHWSVPPLKKWSFITLFSTGSHRSWVGFLASEMGPQFGSKMPLPRIAERRNFMPLATPQRTLTCNLNIVFWRKGIILFNKIFISKEISKNDGYRSQYNTHWKDPPNTLPHSKRKRSYLQLLSAGLHIALHIASHARHYAAGIITIRKHWC